MSSSSTTSGYVVDANRIGFMQGRLTDLVEGRIQAFPWALWQEEFLIAQENSFNLMEWTLDQSRLYENPLLTNSGQARIVELKQRHNIDILSLTGDCFMQMPFWKASGHEADMLKRDFLAVTSACGTIGIAKLIIPLVDNGHIETREQEENLVCFLQSEQMRFQKLGLQVLFESDLEPAGFGRFIGRFDAACFGINYDIGNSAAMGFDPTEEILMYGKRILNVHVKDRLFGGTTVPLGYGAADFRAVFSALKKINYTGNFILQTARSIDCDHVGVLCRYRDMTVDWLRTVHEYTATACY